MPATRLFATTGGAVVRLDSQDGTTFDITYALEGSGAQCVAVDPHDPQRVYIGTLDDGIYRTADGGEHWEQVGEALSHKRVLSIAISPSRRVDGVSAVYAGVEPSNIYLSEDDGASWRDFPSLPELPSAPTWSFPPRPWTSHVRWIALHHDDPQLIFAGIELGGVMRSTDGGETWEDRKPHSYHDVHALLTHPLAPGRVYEAAGGGVALSDDAGETWRTADDGMDRHYVWGLAADPDDPDLWYVSATHSAREAHRSDGEAQARIYRKRGSGPWGPLAVGLSDTLDSMPYALLTLRGRPGTIIAGFKNGDLSQSHDGGDTWRQLNVEQLPGLLALADASG
jgi:photosystem II stability/assembly factor-like uncharacterized protein